MCLTVARLLENAMTRTDAPARDDLPGFADCFDAFAIKFTFTSWPHFGECFADRSDEHTAGDSFADGAGEDHFFANGRYLPKFDREIKQKWRQQEQRHHRCPAPPSD